MRPEQSLNPPNGDFLESDSVKHKSHLEWQRGSG